MTRGCCDITSATGAQDLSEDLERICPVSECGDGELPDDGSFYIYQKSFFKLQYQFIKDGKVIDPRTIDFVFTYFIQDTSDKFVASHIQGNIINLFIDDDKKQINVIFQNPKFDIGKLMVEYRFLVKDEDFISSIQNVYFGDYTNVKITDNIQGVTKPNQFVTKINQNNFNLDIIQTYGV